MSLSSIILYYIIPFLLVLGILIFIHELGHFLTAKFFGVRVLKFSLGFGPRVVGKKVGDTEYIIAAVPLGGYVKMLGESGDEDEMPLTPADEAVSFSNQSIGRRMAIVAAGPLCNLLLALVIFCVFYMMAGVQVLTSEIGMVREDSPAARAGLEKGDVVVALNGTAIDSWPEMKEQIDKSEGEPIEILVERAGERLAFTVIPEISVVQNLFGEDIQTPLIGIVASSHYRQVSLGPIGAMREGAIKTWDMIRLTFLTILKLIQRIIPIETLGGPIMIGQMTGQLAQENWVYLIPFTAIISVNLGILNLLPIPILDGGVLLLLLIERIMGRPLNLRNREVIQKVGIAILVMLMAVVVFNDLNRILG